MKITIAQLNPVVGDIEGNLIKLQKAVEQTDIDGGTLLVTSELFVTGYPPLDLLEHEDFQENIAHSIKNIEKLSKLYPHIALIVGAPTTHSEGRGLYNSALVFLNGKIITTHHKRLLPTYDVFDEDRYFDHGTSTTTFTHENQLIGLTICEDAWTDEVGLTSNKRYSVNPIDDLKKMGADLIINISASPYYVGKIKKRHELFSQHAKNLNSPILFVNQVGGVDELIFDGSSFLANPDGSIQTIVTAFESEIKTFDTEENLNIEASTTSTTELESALVLGIKDYFAKTGFTKAVIGLSGGIDSAITLALTVKALGSQNILAVSMPSAFSSVASVNDAKRLTATLNVQLELIPISNLFDNALRDLSHVFNDTPHDVTEENIQARLRGIIIMAIANKFNYLTLATGNKSELAVGYCTLYGDMSGALAVLGDVYKTQVYELAKLMNSEKEIIPESILNKAPSAELKFDQTDQDTLPPYDILDSILKQYIEENKSKENLLQLGFNEKTVNDVLSMFHRAEYKRRQAPPVLKVSKKAFGIGRRYLLSAMYR